MERRNAARPRRRSVKKIVVIGTGRMGGAFATAFAKRSRTMFQSADRMPALHAKEIRDCSAKVR